MDTVVGARAAAGGTTANFSVRGAGELEESPGSGRRRSRSFSLAVVAVAVARWTSGGARCTPVLPYRDRAIAPRPRLPGCPQVTSASWPMSGPRSVLDCGRRGDPRDPGQHRSAGGTASGGGRGRAGRGATGPALSRTSGFRPRGGVAPAISTSAPDPPVGTSPPPCPGLGRYAG